MKILTFLFLLVSTTAFAQFQYVSPMPGSTLINPEHNIIIREGNLLDPSSLNKNLFTLHGSKSGDFSFRIVLSTDQKTILLCPDHPFGYDEEISVSISSGLRTRSGNAIEPYSFSFTTHPEYTAAEKENFRNLKEIFLSEGIKNVNGKENKNPGSGDRQISGSFTILNDSNPTPGDIFYDAWNGTFFGSTKYDGYNIITPQGDSVFSSDKFTICFDFSINPDGYLSVYNDVKGGFDILDSNYTVIDTYYPGNGYTSDPHEFTRLADGRAFM
ncbi:MAG: Ig-like domain-containing protein, partial [Chitinophagales bacterium]